MAEYSVTFARSARKELEQLDANVVDRIVKKIDGLSEDPRPSGSTKLVGTKDLWRIRIGDYRVVYSIDNKARVVDIAVVRHRKDAYR